MHTDTVVEGGVVGVVVLDEVLFLSFVLVFVVDFVVLCPVW